MGKKLRIIGIMLKSWLHVWLVQKRQNFVEVVNPIASDVSISKFYCTSVHVEWVWVLLRI
jgi:hypothetical protein